MLTNTTNSTTNAPTCTTCHATGFDVTFAIPFPTPHRSRFIRPLTSCLSFPTTSSHRVAQGYHAHTHVKTMSHAIDFEARVGEMVSAARDGIVVELATHFKRGGPDETLRCKANYVVLRHDIGIYSRYYHLKHVSVHVGQVVRQGDLLGQAGMTGYTFGPHLHFDVVDVCGLDIFTATVIDSSEMTTMTINLPCVPTTFSLPPPPHPTRFHLVLANPIDLSSQPPSCNNNVALVSRRSGAKSFREMALFASQAGASCLIIADNDAEMRDVIPILIGDACIDTVGIIVLFVAYSIAATVMKITTTTKCELELKAGQFYKQRSTVVGMMDGEVHAPFCKPVTMPIRFAGNHDIM